MSQIADLLEAYYRIGQRRSESPTALFPSQRSDVSQELNRLWGKYSQELKILSDHLGTQYKKKMPQGLSGGCGDLEGELLYILIRKLKPELIYEISPNTGFSTNYLLAAVTENKSGRIEGFEIIEEIDGVSINEIVYGKLLPICDKERYHLNVGDARINSLERITQQAPDFTLIDSCHDDFFAEFYVKELFPRCCGTIVMQDIAHFDPRPEWSTEAYYVLSYLQKTASEYLLFGDYEDALFNNSARDEFSVRRPCRSNCIVVSLGDAPVTSEPAERFLGYLSGESEPGDGMASAYPLTFEILGGTLRRSFPSEDARPEDDYVAAMTADQWRAGSPAFADMLALSLGRTSLKGAPPGELAQAAQSFDATQRVLALEALARAGARDDMKTILSTVENDPPRGGELHLRIAETALRLGYRAEAERWAERAHENSKDLSLAVGYRHSMQAARILLRLGQAARARSFFREALEGLTRRHDDVMAKASAEAFAIALRHPVFLPIALGSGIDKGAIMVAAKSLIRSIARKVARKILAA